MDAVSKTDTASGTHEVNAFLKEHPLYVKYKYVISFTDYA